jgi:hypothetical protein
MEKTTLNNVARGNAPLLFAREVAKILENIADSRTPARAVRSIVLEFKFAPSEDRCEIVTTVNAHSKLPQSVGVSGLMYVVNDEGELVASNVDPKQLSLVDQLATAKERKTNG